MSLEHDRSFSFCGGHLALDFVNTVAWRLSRHPEERLRSLDHLISWFIQAGIVSRSRATVLRRHGKSSQAQVAVTLAQAIATRELIYRLFEAILRKRRPEAKDLTEINRVARATSTSASIDWNGRSYEWRGGERTSVPAILEQITRFAVELLMSSFAEKVARCQDDRGCGWLFLDNSRAGARRWCSMADCGNRAKVRAHYHRSRHTKAHRVRSRS